MGTERFEQILTVVEFVIGALLIVFRKRFINSVFSRQLKKSKPKDKKLLRDLEDTGYNWLLYKVGDVAALIVGLFLVVSSVSAFFFPLRDEYVAYIVQFAVLSIISAGVAGILLLIISPLLFRKVNKYLREIYAEQWPKYNSLSLKKRLEFMSHTKDISDTKLRKLRINATIYAVICFVFFFIVTLIAQYIVIKATS